jgi:hypothetical protein
METKPGKKTTELGALGGTGLVAALPVVFGALPKEQTWIALVVFGAVAGVYIVCRTLTKLRAPSQ